jgi:hypothetical protein
MTQMNLRDFKLPDMTFRGGKLRDLALPEIDLRDRLSDLHVHDIHVPNIHMPEMKAPDIDMSAIDVRGLDPRRLDLSGIDAHRLRELSPFVRRKADPASPLPWIIVAGVGGLFAGWWLATSSATGPMIRRMTHGVHRHLDAWRNSRAEWNDGEDRAEGFWSTEDGWKDEGSQGGAARPDGTWSDTPAAPEIDEPIANVS